MLTRCRPTGAILAAILAIPIISLRAQSGREEPWPPPGVYRLSEGVTPPRVTFEVKPRYTAPAMRARIEGIVVLACVVNADGTVGPVRVERSLDAERGLDRAAIDAVKQWQFTAGTKDGVAVPVLAVIEMRFSIATGPPVLEWPAAFVTTLVPARWTEREVIASGLAFRLAYPPHWDAHDGSGSSVFSVHHLSGEQSFRIEQPRPTPMRIEQPLTPERLRGVAEKLAAMVMARGSEVSSVGQIRAGKQLWMWVEATLRSLETARAAMPAELADRMTWKGGRIWIFSTTSGDQFVQVGGMVLYPGCLSANEIEDRTRAAGADFRRIVEEFSIMPSKM
jgi:TonB family protein